MKNRVLVLMLAALLTAAAALPAGALEVGTRLGSLLVESGNDNSGLRLDAPGLGPLGLPVVSLRFNQEGSWFIEPEVSFTWRTAGSNVLLFGINTRVGFTLDAGYDNPRYLGGIFSIAFSDMEGVDDDTEFGFGAFAGKRFNLAGGPFSFRGELEAVYLTDREVFRGGVIFGLAVDLD
jgi:hypothetical protein